VTQTRPRSPESKLEAARISAVRRYEILDSAPDEAFDEICRLTAQLLHVPVALVTIVDSDRIWFKSHYGVQDEQVPRDPGLCASTILQDDAWVVADAATHPAAKDNPLVSGAFGLRFYAGAPLKTPDGFNIGTLCVIDFAPRCITDQGVATLQRLATLVMNEVELRVAERERLQIQSERRRDAEQRAYALRQSLLPGGLPKTPGLDVVARYHVANREQVGGDFYDVVTSEDGIAMFVGDVCGKGPDAAAMTAQARWALRTVMLDAWTPSAALDRLNQVLVRAEEIVERHCTVALARARTRPTGDVDLMLALGGHPRPLIVRADGSIEHVGQASPIIGYFPDAAFQDAETTLAPGELMILFTGGMLEAIQGRGSTEDGKLGALLSPMAGLDATSVADRLDDALRTSALCDGWLRDDAAYLVVRAAC
jgi:sigma-B regulation protein RsbU (phosphoserine phosphatase)